MSSGKRPEPSACAHLAYASTSHKGAAGELIAAQQLMAQGYEVFRNVSPCGPADLIAWNPRTGGVRLFDAKTASGQLTPEQRRAGVELFRLPKDGIRAVEGTEHLKLKYRTWFVRLSVPSALRPIIGKREYMRSLKTRSLAEANERKHVALAEFRAELEAAAARLA